MAGCKTENWTVKDIAEALQNNHKDNKVIVVPMFQRGQRWKKEQQKIFIDSLIKGYPVGAFLFFEKYENNQFTYILVDGLQRGSCIRNYITNPTEFFENESIPDEVCSSILELIGVNKTENYAVVRDKLTNFIKAQNSFKNLMFFEVAGEICGIFKEGFDFTLVNEVTKLIMAFFKDKQDLYESIASVSLPVNVYSGPEETLPEIFERINSKGTPLDQYEIYAAAWPVKDKFVIQNSEIIEYVVKKYDTLVNAGYTIHGYNSEELRKEKKVNAFEYLFGLSRYLVNKYDILAFNKNITDDAVNPLAFELVNACLNDADRIRILYKNIKDLDINVFEKALTDAIEFVRDSVSVVTRFKGNAHNANKIFHSKYQIMSMISTSFKEMYPDGNYKSVDAGWAAKKQTIAKNLVQYYVYDIITNYWSEGGTGKIHAAAKPNRYMSEISGRSWTVALDGFFEKSMMRSEKKNVASPKSEEFVLLNCIYVKTFTAMDQLSIDKFDVEHIAPKEQMRKLIETCSGDGLPISCIANLCYLPQTANRSKGAKNFYQDKKYLVSSGMNLDEIEEKYSFTEEEDLEWMDMPYEKPDDFSVLKEYYIDYCTRRFDKLKHMFCNAMGISYVDSKDAVEEKTEVVVSADKGKKTTQVRFSDKCVQRLADNMGEDLIGLSRSVFRTSDKAFGYAVTTSKVYQQGSREKYWFAYRRTELIDDCAQKYYIFGCGNESTLIRLPVDLIEKNLDRLNISLDEDGKITHWHMVFFKDKSGHMTWMFSKPEIEEISVDEYLV